MSCGMEQHRSLQELMAVRREKLEVLRRMRVEVFGGRYEVDGSVGEVVNGFEVGRVVRVAGRVTAHRDMGKSHFLDLWDFSGRVQVYVNEKEVERRLLEVLRLVDIGDFLGVCGEFFLTKTGERTIRVKEMEFLTKAMRPLPDKWHGVVDVEKRTRQRYLDLIANERSREIFEKRIRIVRLVRRFLEERGFVEVETPMLQIVAGGAAATPFRTHHNALDVDLYLRIAPELYLKRLLVGGMTKIFELNRNFRNEGISRRHNPEFTMLEAYWAFADFEKMSELVEEMICTVAEEVCGGLRIEHRSEDGEVKRVINLERPWRRAKYRDLVEEAVPGWFDLTVEERRQKALGMGLDLTHCQEDYEVTQHVFEKLVEEKIVDPVFVTHCPKELIPLAKLNKADPSTIEVYELIANGQEISPGYSELNDPDLQRKRFEEQSGGEKQKLDEDFLVALEYGMPPAGGMGLGIDRLVMMLTGAETIRDVIFFPHLRPEGQ
ncbi:MAG: lysine--tRNA ligase [Chthoniobacterales bacterium]|nr:lysine--tRNA ligase [Chthoniobacterales bacterium]